MEKMEQLQANLEFVCKHEEKPELSQETQQLYNYALYHDLHNMWTDKKGDAVWNGLARYYRIAAMNGERAISKNTVKKRPLFESAFKVRSSLETFFSAVYFNNRSASLAFTRKALRSAVSIPLLPPGNFTVNGLTGRPLMWNS